MVLTIRNDGLDHNFHPAVQAASDFGAVISAWFIFTHSICRKALFDHTLGQQVISDTVGTPSDSV